MPLLQVLATVRLGEDTTLKGADALPEGARNAGRSAVCMLVKVPDWNSCRNLVGKVITVTFFFNNKKRRLSVFHLQNMMPLYRIY